MKPFDAQYKIGDQTSATKKVLKQYVIFNSKEYQPYNRQQLEYKNEYVLATTKEVVTIDLENKTFELLKDENKKKLPFYVVIIKEDHFDGKEKQLITKRIVLPMLCTFISFAFHRINSEYDYVYIEPFHPYNDVDSFIYYKTTDILYGYDFDENEQYEIPNSVKLIDTSHIVGKVKQKQII